VLKDRLYAEAAEGPDRRAAQFVLARLHDNLTRLLAPFIPHTAEESWDYFPASPSKPRSVHLTTFPEPDAQWDDPERDARWKILLSARESILVTLEDLRKKKIIGSAQDAVVKITGSPDLSFLAANRDLLATLCNVSEVTVDAQAVNEGSGLVAAASHSSYSKCERCWNYRPSVGQSPDHPTLCARCVSVLSQ
jgi:isoleucyl-tRNA synthetase